ncbi:MAG TPA: VCBS repeat-containing protein, partial [Planctomycetota bacterium]|nr:VCBS repeat-containing protein [Planctomycetota bacterium]
PDLVGAGPPPGSFSGPLGIRYGLGGGAFGTPVGPIAPDIHTGDQIAVVDFDGDGDLDVGEAHAGRTIHLNDGFGGFAATLVLPMGPSPPTGFGSFLALDLDVDGLLDVVASPGSFAGFNGVDIYRRLGPGLSFAPLVSQTVVATSVADVDGDGDIDSVSHDVVRNRRFEGATAGLRRQYGLGLPGSGGMIPTLGAAGPFRPGQAADLRMTGGLGGVSAVLVLGTSELSIPILGGTLLALPQVAIPLVLAGTPGVPGEGSFTFPWVVAPGLAGQSAYCQVGVLDPGAPQSVAFSNGLRVTVGL